MCLGCFLTPAVGAAARTSLPWCVWPWPDIGRLTLSGYLERAVEAVVTTVWSNFCPLSPLRPLLLPMPEMLLPCRECCRCGRRCRCSPLPCRSRLRLPLLRHRCCRCCSRRPSPLSPLADPHLYHLSPLLTHPADMDCRGSCADLGLVAICDSGLAGNLGDLWFSEVSAPSKQDIGWFAGGALRGGRGWMLSSPRQHSDSAST
jgi:hypothetical protein